jgi:hypothetical protein
MINLEITESPDDNVITEFRYFQNQIYLGRTSGDLWIQDNELRASHLMLEVIGQDLLIHPQRDVEFYLLNGKRASAIRKLKVNDRVTFGKTSFRIIAFSETIRESKKEILNNKLNMLIEESSSRISVIETLTKLMKQ